MFGIPGRNCTFTFRLEDGRAICYATGTNFGSPGTNRTCDCWFNKPVPQTNRGIEGMELTARIALALLVYETSVLLLDDASMEGTSGFEPPNSGFADRRVNRTSPRAQKICGRVLEYF